MEIQTKPTCTREKDSFEFANIFDDHSDNTQTRLAALLAANLEIKRDKENYHNEQERFEASLMKSPITSEKAFAYFGAMLGLFPPFALFSKLLFSPHSHPEPFVIGVMLLINVICAVVG